MASIAKVTARDALPRTSRHIAAHIFLDWFPMRKLTFEIMAAMALTLSAILALAPGVLANDVMVMDAFARASATPKASSAAAYIKLVNRGAETDRLLSITTDGAAMAQLHETKSLDGVISMSAVEILELPPGQTAEMKPGGLHIMLMGLKAPLKKGGTLSLDLNFEKAGKITVEVPIEGVAATGSGQASGG
ncbi:MAG: copper chaperone PCu(A)C [Rhizobiales bacterium]|nr:copper chaperone PCu(A)C [Hyphomicrobiales bacterium]